VREFEVGAVVQTVADQLSAEQAQADVELVLLQQGDLGLRSVTVWGDREGIAFVLSHVSRNQKGARLFVCF
jgi:osomolarity two-component system response regulator SSK1